jgi:hypothetical protein
MIGQRRIGDNATMVDLDPARLATLRNRDRAVLRHNVRRFMVTPSDELYGADGNTWGYLWDTMFAVMAIAIDDVELADHLFTNYLAGQHPTGMVPHMVMWSSGFPKGMLVADLLWAGYRARARDVDGRPVHTSSITQPPLLAVAAGRILDALPDEPARVAFSRRVGPALMAYHSWLYCERELNDDGLVVTVHPHETGRDDAPSHAALLRAIRLSAPERLLLSPAVQRFGERNRTDLDHGRKDISERSSTDTMARAAELATFRLRILHRRMKRSGRARVPRSHPYLHLDPGFNAILDRANGELARIAAAGAIELAPRLAEAMARTAAGLQLLWDPVARGFRGLDAHGAVSFAAGREIGDLLPIYSDHITDEQTRAIIELLDDEGRFGGAYLPTVDRSSPDYRPNQFWNGPEWPPTTNLVLDGLYRKAVAGHPAARAAALRLGHAALDSAMSDDTLPEYRNSRTGEPRGAHQFSWTAALTINALDLLGRNGDLYFRS